MPSSLNPSQVASLPLRHSTLFAPRSAELIVFVTTTCLVLLTVTWRSGPPFILKFNSSYFPQRIHVCDPHPLLFVYTKRINVPLSPDPQHQQPPFTEVSVGNIPRRNPPTLPTKSNSPRSASQRALLLGHSGYAANSPGLTLFFPGTTIAANTAYSRRAPHLLRSGFPVHFRPRVNHLEVAVVECVRSWLGPFPLAKPCTRPEGHPSHHLCGVVEIVTGTPHSRKFAVDHSVVT